MLFASFSQAFSSQSDTETFNKTLSTLPWREILSISLTKGSLASTSSINLYQSQNRIEVITGRSLNETLKQFQKFLYLPHSGSKARFRKFKSRNIFSRSWTLSTRFATKSKVKTSHPPPRPPQSPNIPRKICVWQFYRSISLPMNVKSFIRWYISC